MSLSGSVGGEVGIAWTPSRAYGPRGNTTSLVLTAQQRKPEVHQLNFLVSYLATEVTHPGHVRGKYSIEITTVRSGFLLWENQKRRRLEKQTHIVICF
jgi:hypothetical protein